MSDWIVYALAGAVAVVFYESATRLHIAADARRVLQVAPEAASVLSSSTLSDEEKESTMRRMSVAILRATLRFVAKLAVVLALCLAVVLLGQLAFSLPQARVVSVMLSWPVLLGLIPFALLYAGARRAVVPARAGATADGATADGATAHGTPAVGSSVERTPIGGAPLDGVPADAVPGADVRPTGSRAKGPGTDEGVGTSDYGTLARLLHRVAFAHPALQRVLGEMEDDMYAKALADVRVERPLFVTGLPRAGTTLVLELLHRSGGFAPFTYRQMPFVQTPLLWARVGAGFAREGKSAERAHGDGVEISYDSPEAFEEVLWLDRLGARIRDGAGGQRPLGAADVTPEFRDAFTRLARKLVHLVASRGGGAPDGGTPRYLSKNNANIARLPALAALFPDARVLCCYRHPATQVPSLHAQHLRFLALHEHDAFARSYMRWIGHHDFGANFLPIRFRADGTAIDGTAADGAAAQGEAAATGRTFWLRYWIDAYEHALAHAPSQVRFVGFERLSEGGETALARLAEAAGLSDPAPLLAQASRLRRARSEPEDLHALAPELADEALATYARLEARAAL